MLVLVCALELAAREPTAAGPATRPAPRVAVFHGYVQVFSHAAITVRSRRNRADLRTFTYSRQLRHKLRYQHLVYGEKISVYYDRQSELAVRIRAKTYPGS